MLRSSSEEKDFNVKISGHESEDSIFAVFYLYTKKALDSCLKSTYVNKYFYRSEFEG